MFLVRIFYDFYCYLFFSSSIKTHVFKIIKNISILNNKKILNINIKNIFILYASLTIVVLCSTLWLVLSPVRKVANQFYFIPWESEGFVWFIPSFQ